MKTKKCQSFLYHPKNEHPSQNDNVCWLYKTEEFLFKNHEKLDATFENTNIEGCKEACKENKDCDAIVYYNQNKYFYFSKLNFKAEKPITVKDRNYTSPIKNCELGRYTSVFQMCTYSDDVSIF